MAQGRRASLFSPVLSYVDKLKNEAAEYKALMVTVAKNLEKGHNKIEEQEENLSKEHLEFLQSLPDLDNYRNIATNFEVSFKVYKEATIAAEDFSRHVLQKLLN